MSGTEPVPSARELILELVELQDRIDEVRVTEPPAAESPDGSAPDPATAARPAGPTGPTELAELAELEQREEEVIAELRDYRETQLRLPSPPPP